MNAPPIVHQVLNSPGRPLDASTRSFMEPRFGHDFGRVRVHADMQAARSARAVNALAYTVGSDLVFAQGQYAPHSPEGQRLLGHELTHVVQQSSSTLSAKENLQIGSADDALEREAETTAQQIVKGTSIHTPSRRSHAAIQRDNGKKEDTIDVELWPTAPDEIPKGVDLPKVSAETWKLLTYKPGQPLQPGEKAIMEAHLKKAGVSTGTGTVAGVGSGAKFLLHDTSSPTSAAGIQHQAAIGRGPMGKGVSAFVPKSQPATITRPSFYESKRPSTTEWEKNVEAFSQAADAKLKPEEKIKAWKQRRDDQFRTIWNDTQPTERSAALDRALAGGNLTSQEIQEQKTGNKLNRSDEDFNPGAEVALKAGSSENMTTSSSWAIEEICSHLNAKNVKAMAVSGKEKELTDTCTALAPYFTERNKRIESTVTVEIVQPGVKSKKGSQNTCDPNNKNIAPLDNPPYSDLQYQNIVSLYFRSALFAGVFPEVTTHFVADAFIQGHCDPRCFNLTKLYKMIAQAVGHSTACIYGPTPSYGRKWGTNNVWWDDTICHGSHP
jgi:Domain of unknown function (DUF4157)